jgi:hypothetical protein
MYYKYSCNWLRFSPLVFIYKTSVDFNLCKMKENISEKILEVFIVSKIVWPLQLIP